MVCLPRRRQVLLLVPAVFFSLLLLGWWQVQVGHGYFFSGAPESIIRATAEPTHPISSLILESRARLDKVLAARSYTLSDAARRYRERRGRHPPPGFDAWFEAAMKVDAIIVEDFFDSIHHAINPFWALDPGAMRNKTHNQPFLVRVRGGKVTTDVESDHVPYRVEQWAKLVDEMSPHIPDLDMFVNVMDEARVFVPWDTMRGYMETEGSMRKQIDVKDARGTYTGVGAAETLTDEYDPHWARVPREFWDHFRRSCPPDTPGADVSLADGGVDKVTEPVLRYTYGGFVRNVTEAQDACWQPHLRGLHGTFVEGVSMATTEELLPMFAESKLPRNSEMLIPAAVYLDGWEKYSGGWARGAGWRSKKDKLIWRGSASGGRTNKENWTHMHRHRFVQMLNGTTVSALEAGDEDAAPTFDLPKKPDKQGKLGEWVSGFADVGFTDILCNPEETYTHWWKGEQHSPGCGWLSPWFSVADEVSMLRQYGHKYLPDVDGNSFSGRYRAFLLSSSLPLKATMYAEWHDDRLFPWVHYAPFDNSYVDIFGVMEYFLANDDMAETIATEGQAWAEKVLRREDMRIHTWRLLLEYARVVDDEREYLAYVDDLR